MPDPESSSKDGLSEPVPGARPGCLVRFVLRLASVRNLALRADDHEAPRAGLRIALGADLYGVTGGSPWHTLNRSAMGDECCSRARQLHHLSLITYHAFSRFKRYAFAAVP